MIKIRAEQFGICVEKSSDAEFILYLSTKPGTPKIVSKLSQLSQQTNKGGAKPTDDKKEEVKPESGRIRRTDDHDDDVVPTIIISKGNMHSHYIQPISITNEELSIKLSLFMKVPK